MKTSERFTFCCWRYWFLRDKFLLFLFKDFFRLLCRGFMARTREDTHERCHLFGRNSTRIYLSHAACTELGSMHIHLAPRTQCPWWYSISVRTSALHFKNGRTPPRSLATLSGYWWYCYLINYITTSHLPACSLSRLLGPVNCRSYNPNFARCANAALLGSIAPALLAATPREERRTIKKIKQQSEEQRNARRCR